MRAVLVKKLLYKSKHRGCKETDVILGRFADKFIDDMNIEDLIVFAKILEQSDVDIYDWCVGARTVPFELDSQTMKRLIEFTVNE